MNIITRISGFFIILMSTVLLIPGCSYIMDSIEGAITERSSFSIEASYDSSTGELTITWDETGSSSNFAGFEIYRTYDADDEYAGYGFIASRYTTENDTTVSYGDYQNLDNIYTGSFSYTPSESGIYFYRVGIIKWTEDDEQERIKDTDPFDYFYDNESYYNTSTEIDQISGYKKVDLP